MKLKNLQEQNPNNYDHIIMQMDKWCRYNIIDYLNMYDAEDEDLLQFYPHSNQIFINACEVETIDEELPFGLIAGEFFTIRGSNLTSFKNMPDLDSHYGTLPPMTFKFCDKLDFTQMYHDTSHLNIQFNNSRNISPRTINKNQIFAELLFEWCTSDSICDISEYVALSTIKMLTIFGVKKRLSHLTDIFDTRIESIGNLRSSVYSSREESFLIDGLNKYLKLSKDHIMDFTVELIDNGFEEDL